MSPETTTSRVLLAAREGEHAAGLRVVLESTRDVVCVGTVAELADAGAILVSQRVDAILADISIGSTAVETIASLHRSAPAVAIIVTVDDADEALGLESMGAGALDFLVRSELSGCALTHILRHARAHRRHRVQLARRDDQLAEVQRIARLGSFEWDIVTNTVEWSDELYRIFGMDREHFNPTYQGFLDLIVSDDRDRVDQIVRGALERREPYELEHRAIHGSGATIVLHARGHIVLDDAGQPIRIAGTGQDVTDRKKLEEKLLFAGRMTSVGTLAAGVAHEINNPLTYLLANLEFIAKEVATRAHGSSPEQIRELTDMVDDARQGAERIRQIVRGMKMFSRSDEERRVPLDIEPVLEAAINLTANEIRHRARLVRDYGTTPMVEADETRLSQVFVNLLINAAQAFGERAAEGNEIHVSTSTDPNGSAVIEIRDTGVGIPDANRDRIFDPFFTTQPIGMGTGLGLAICHGIVTAHRGEITVDTTVGVGTIFRVSLPGLQAPPAHEIRG